MIPDITRCCKAEQVGQPAVGIELHNLNELQSSVNLLGRYCRCSRYVSHEGMSVRAWKFTSKAYAWTHFLKKSWRRICNKYFFLSSPPSPDVSEQVLIFYLHVWVLVMLLIDQNWEGWWMVQDLEILINEPINCVGWGERLKLGNSSYQQSQAKKIVNGQILGDRLPDMTVTET